MNEIKEHIGIDCDLSFCSLIDAIGKFKEKFNFMPEDLTLEVGVNNIFVAFDIRELKHQFALKNLWFQCDKDFPKDYWQISAFKDCIKYIIYSIGA